MCACQVGVDLSPAQIDVATRRLAKLKRDSASDGPNVTFMLQDASALAQFKSNHFDAACISMALHEMPAAARVVSAAGVPRMLLMTAHTPCVLTSFDMM